MGHITHYAIIVTSDDENAIDRAFDYASLLSLCPTQKSLKVTNNYFSFLIPPDGGRVGFTTNSAYSLQRSSFIKFLRNQPKLEWVMVEYGDDDNTAKVTTHKWDSQDIEDLSPGELLKTFREKLWWNQKYLASRLCISVKKLREMEKGISPIDAITAKRLEAIFLTPWHNFMKLENHND